MVERGRDFYSDSEDTAMVNWVFDCLKSKERQGYGKTPCGNKIWQEFIKNNESTHKPASLQTRWSRQLKHRVFDTGAKPEAILTVMRECKLRIGIQQQFALKAKCHQYKITFAVVNDTHKVVVKFRQKDPDEAEEEEEEEEELVEQKAGVKQEEKWIKGELNSGKGKKKKEKRRRVIVESSSSDDETVEHSKVKEPDMVNTPTTRSRAKKPKQEVPSPRDTPSAWDLDVQCGSRESNPSTGIVHGSDAEAELSDGEEITEQKPPVLEKNKENAPPVVQSLHMTLDDTMADDPLHLPTQETLDSAFFSSQESSWTKDNRRKQVKGRDQSMDARVEKASPTMKSPVQSLAVQSDDRGAKTPQAQFKYPDISLLRQAVDLMRKKREKMEEMNDRTVDTGVNKSSAPLVQSLKLEVGDLIDDDPLHLPTQETLDSTFFSSQESIVTRKDNNKKEKDQSINAEVDKSSSTVKDPVLSHVSEPAGSNDTQGAFQERIADLSTQQREGIKNEIVRRIARIPIAKREKEKCALAEAMTKAKSPYLRTEAVLQHLLGWNYRVASQPHDAGLCDRINMDTINELIVEIGLASEEHEYPDYSVSYMQLVIPRALVNLLTKASEELTEEQWKAELQKSLEVPDEDEMLYSQEDIDQRWKRVTLAIASLGTSFPPPEGKRQKLLWLIVNNRLFVLEQQFLPLLKGVEHDWINESLSE